MKKVRKLKNKKSYTQRLWRNIFVFLFIYAVILLGFIALDKYVELQNTKATEVVFSPDQTETIQTNSQGQYIYDVNVSVSKQWVTDKMVGAQYDGYIYNRTDIAISDWTIDITVPAGSWIDSDWNGYYEFSNNELHLYVTPMDYNNTVVPGGHQTFGMIMYTYENFTPTEMVFSFYRNTAITDYAEYYTLIVLAILTTIIAAVVFISDIRVRAYSHRQEQYKSIIDETLDAFATVIDAKDEYTNGHSIRVANYACEIARRMGLDDDAQENIHIIALLHDIGKVGIPDAILNKPGKLSPEELEIVRAHTSVGERILTNFTSVENIANGAHYHHERFDGTGYPTGISGKDIPLCARIICIADSYDAMSSTRCYREMLSSEEIIEEFTRCSGTQFDPDIVPYVIDMIKDMTTAKVDNITATSY